ncbi:MAG: hypothetical protein P4L64_04605, partial [Caulobacteraceae bacterium]|nr:hypothetical protein [Caulobacteraceae bacterium]
RLAAPGCFCVTHDELALVALFAAAQEGAHERLDAHLTWLLGARPERPLAAAASLVAQALDFNGHLIRPPGQTGERPALQGDLSNELQPIALIRDADPTQPGLTRWS